MRITKPILGCFSPIKNGFITVWVADETTFYQLLLVFKDELSRIKINFYEFKCVGFRYKTYLFKRKELKLLGALSLKCDKYSYSYGAYALNLLKEFMHTGQVKPTLVEQGDKARLRAAFVGGRNEFIADPVPGHQLYGIDFNTMYLTCLKTEFLSGKIARKELSQVGCPGFYYVTFETGLDVVPVLFMKNKTTEQGFFCRGRAEGLFWHEELKLFLACGGVLHKIHYAYVGEDYSCNFRPFTDYLSRLGSKKLSKQLANNLYGRLAMKDYFYPTKLATDVEFFLHYEKTLIKRWVQWGEFYIYEDLEYTTYANYTDICAAAAITSKARIKLYKLLCELKTKTNICLLNTDEVIISDVLPPNLAGD